MHAGEVITDTGPSRDATAAGRTPRATDPAVGRVAAASG